MPKSTTSVFNASLLNTYASTDIVTDTSMIPNMYRILGIFPITKGTLQGITAINPTAEVRQEVTIGGAVAPVVAASSKYTIILGNTDNTREGAHLQNMPYNYISPPALTGTAATDRYNMYYRLALNINNNISNFCQAYNMITITQTNTAAFAENEIITQSVSGAVGINIKTVSGGAAGTTGTLTIGVISGTFTTASATLTGSVTGTASATAATITTGIGLRIIDDAGYFPANGGRTGVNTVVLPAVSAWATPATMIVVTTTGVYSFGQGTRMAQDVPVLERTSPNLASGTWEMATNNAPVGGATYQCYKIIDTVSASSGMPGSGNNSITRTQVLWLEKTDASGTPITNYAATNTAILALNP